MVLQVEDYEQAVREGVSNVLKTFDGVERLSAEQSKGILVKRGASLHDSYLRDICLFAIVLCSVQQTDCLQHQTEVFPQMFSFLAVSKARL